MLTNRLSLFFAIAEACLFCLGVSNDFSGTTIENTKQNGHAETSCPNRQKREISPGTKWKLCSLCKETTGCKEQAAQCERCKKYCDDGYEEEVEGKMAKAYTPYYVTTNVLMIGDMLRMLNLEIDESIMSVTLYAKKTKARGEADADATESGGRPESRQKLSFSEPLYLATISNEKLVQAITKYIQGEPDGKVQTLHIEATYKAN